MSGCYHGIKYLLVAQNRLRTLKNSIFLIFKTAGDQITDFTQHMRTYLCITIYYKYQGKIQGGYTNKGGNDLEARAVRPFRKPLKLLNSNFKGLKILEKLNYEGCSLQH